MDKIEPMLRELAEKLGVTVEYLWPHLVGHAWARSLAELLGSIPCFIAAYLGYRLVKWGASDAGKYDDIPAYVGGSALFVMSLVFGCILLFGSIPGLLYPEAKALLEIMKMVR